MRYVLRLFVSETSRKMKTIVLTIVLTVSGAIASANDVTVQTSFGPLIGTAGDGPLGANSFKGIP